MKPAFPQHGINTSEAERQSVNWCRVLPLAIDVAIWAGAAMSLAWLIMR